MNLDQTFCASNCQNYDCKRMISYSIIKRVERGSRQLRHDDFSQDCDEYIKPAIKEIANDVGINSQF